LSVLAVAAGVTVFFGVGRFLAREDPLQPADAIVVLAGTRVERPLEAVDLYLAHYAPRIVLSRGNLEDDAIHVVEARGATVVSDTDLLKTMMTELGVPAEALISPTRGHDNTAQEARTVREIALEEGWRRIIIVSSKYHLRRVSMAFGRTFRGTDVQILVHGSRYDPSTPERWWRRRGDVRWLMSELPKVAAYAAGLGE
jgi:uncharacterized SAM-binding protein YcdF (DUF218 family)